MINRVILHMNNRVYSFLNPSMVTMKENPLYLVESGFHQCIINPVISFEFACFIAEDIKKHNRGRRSIRGHILSGKNYEIVITSIDFMRNNFYPMGITAIMRD